MGLNMEWTLDIATLKNLIGEDVLHKIRCLGMGQCMIMTDEGYSTYSIGTKESPDRAVTPEVGIVLKDIDILPLRKEIKEDLGI